jgi:hypothetical protein
MKYIYVACDCVLRSTKRVFSHPRCNKGISAKKPNNTKTNKLTPPFQINENNSNNNYVIFLLGDGMMGLFLAL